MCLEFLWIIEQWQLPAFMSDFGPFGFEFERIYLGFCYFALNVNSTLWLGLLPCWQKWFCSRHPEIDMAVLHYSLVLFVDCNGNISNRPDIITGTFVCNFKNLQRKIIWNYIITCPISLHCKKTYLTFIHFFLWHLHIIFKEDLCFFISYVDLSLVCNVAVWSWKSFAKFFSISVSVFLNCWNAFIVSWVSSGNEHVTIFLI